MNVNNKHATFSNPGNQLNKQDKRLLHRVRETVEKTAAVFRRSTIHQEMLAEINSDDEELETSKTFDQLLKINVRIGDLKNRIGNAKEALNNLETIGVKTLITRTEKLNQIRKELENKKSDQCLSKIQLKLEKIKTKENDENSHEQQTNVELQFKALKEEYDEFSLELSKHEQECIDFGKQFIYVENHDQQIKNITNNLCKIRNEIADIKEKINCLDPLNKKTLSTRKKALQSYGNKIKNINKNIVDLQNELEMLKKSKPGSSKKSKKTIRNIKKAEEQLKIVIEDSSEISKEIKIGKDLCKNLEGNEIKKKKDREDLNESFRIMLGSNSPKTRRQRSKSGLDLRDKDKPFRSIKEKNYKPRIPVKKVQSERTIIAKYN